MGSQWAEITHFNDCNEAPRMTAKRLQEPMADVGQWKKLNGRFGAQCMSLMQREPSFTYMVHCSENVWFDALKIS